MPVAVEVTFRFGDLEVRRSLSLCEQPVEVLRRVRLKRVPNPLVETAHQLANDVELKRDLLYGVFHELVTKL